MFSQSAHNKAVRSMRENIIMMLVRYTLAIKLEIKIWNLTDFLVVYYGFVTSLVTLLFSSTAVVYGRSPKQSYVH
jgi:large-conductance mechanosensitive channel